METRAALVDAYNRSAPIYDQTAGMIYLEALRKYLPRVRVGPWPAILDMGCGTGINLLEAARVLGPCRRLQGVDLSPGMVETARRKAVAAGVPATFEVSDAEDLPLDDASFDLVICNSVYNWCSHRPRAVAEMSRVLSPGGQALVTCVADPGFQEWIHTVDDVRRRLLKEDSSWLPPLPTAAELMHDLRATGLTLEHLEYEVNLATVQDVGAFLNVMTVIAPTWLAGVPEALCGAVRAAATEALTGGAAAPFVVTVAAVGSVARKPAR
jgi:ubiquinone/menaquinone biosynthesis C-methylase UbiE